MALSSSPIEEEDYAEENWESDEEEELVSGNRGEEANLDNGIIDEPVDDNYTNIKKIEKAIADNYQVKDFFTSPAVLKSSLAEVANRYGFVVRLQGMSVVCNRASRAGKEKVNSEIIDRSSATNSRDTTSIDCGCPFKISFNYSESLTAYERAEASPKMTRHSDKIHITRINASHDNGCFPSVQQAKHCLRVSGALVSKESAAVLVAINLVNSTIVSPKVLRKLLQSAVPRNLVLTSQDVVNFRLWARKNGDRIQNEHGAIVPLHQQNVARILAGECVEYKELSLTQPALFEAAAILREVLAGQLATEQGPHLLNYLELLKTKDEGFDYRIAWSQDNKVVGVVWQTSTMRANFSRYGECLFLDFMKRKLNCINWPYIGPCVIDGYKKVRVVAEGIFASEREDAYTFVLLSLFEMSGYTRLREDVHAVFADGFFSDTILEKAGIGATCKYFWDQYHLWNSDWPKFFGGAFAGPLLDSLKGMLYAKSDVRFEAALIESKNLVRTNPRFLDYVTNLGANRGRYATFAVEAAKGTLKRHGSSHAEQNHASVIAHIGDHLYEDPAKEVELLLQRQAHQDQIMSQHVSKHSLVAVSERKALSDRGAPQELQQAKTTLSDWGYDLFHESWSLHLSYMVELDVENNYRVWHKNQPDKVRTVSHSSGCDCTTRMSLLAMCCHEIAIRRVQGLSTFSQNLFARRWHQLSDTEYIPRVTENPNADRVSLKNDNDTIVNTEADIRNNGGDENYDDASNDLLHEPMPASYSYKELMRAASELVVAALSRKADNELMGYIQNGMQTMYGDSVGDQTSTTKSLQGEESLREFAHRFNRSMSFRTQDRSITLSQNAQRQSTEQLTLLSQNTRMQFTSLPPTSQMQQPLTQIHQIQQTSSETQQTQQLPVLQAEPTLALLAPQSQTQPTLLSCPQHRNTSKKRLRSAYEQSKSGLKQGSKGVIQCGFCQVPGHTQRTCEAKEAIGDALNVTAVRTLSNFIVTQCALEGMPDQQLVPSSANILLHIPDSKSVKSICYHGIFYQRQDLPNKTSHFCKLSLYDDRGLKPRNYREEHYFINVGAVSEWMIQTLNHSRKFVFTPHFEGKS